MVTIYRLTPSQLASAFSLWKRGYDTYDIARALRNAQRAKGDDPVTEAHVANSLSALWEKLREDALCAKSA